MDNEIKSLAKSMSKGITISFDAAALVFSTTAPS